MEILRYEKQYIIQSDLDPIEDMLNFMTSLKSKGFASEILVSKHGFTNRSEIAKTAKLISLHIDTATGLAAQAFEGPPQNSFLPLYYSTLNIVKVYLLFLRKGTELESNRWHGARYNESEMARNFLNERIKIQNKGTIPLIYKTITGKTIGRNGLEINLKEIYGCISSIAAEYSTITNNDMTIMYHSAKIIEDNLYGHYIKVDIADMHYQGFPPSPRKIKAYSGLRLVQNQHQLPYYESKRFQGNINVLRPQMLSLINRQLISDQIIKGNLGMSGWISCTPINGRYHVFNEDLSILLAYFHLSNVVRYNPEHLYKLMDSKYWAIILALRKHGFLRFLKLMWGNINKTSFDIE